MLNGLSTDEEVFAAYDDNASYLEEDSVAKGRAFQTACIILIRRIPTTVQENNSMAQFDPKLIANQLEEVRDWLASNDTARSGSSSRLSDLRNFRC